MTEPARILVVDDNSTNRMKMRMAVRNLGHSAEVAENGAVALQMLRHEAFDAVLLDIVMPEVDGYGVCRRSRRTRSCAMSRSSSSHPSTTRWIAW
jgi:CheY-like chemotaxis protein